MSRKTRRRKTSSYARSDGDDAELVEFLVDECVDVVELRELRAFVGEIRGDDDGLRAFGEGVEAG